MEFGLVWVSERTLSGFGIEFGFLRWVGGARTDGGMVAGRGSVVRDGRLGFGGRLGWRRFCLGF